MVREPGGGCRRREDLSWVGRNAAGKCGSCDVADGRGRGVNKGGGGISEIDKAEKEDNK
jgi:hypothetical protein